MPATIVGDASISARRQKEHLVLEGVGVERLRIYVEENCRLFLLRILGVVSSNLVGRATADGRWALLLCRSAMMPEPTARFSRTYCEGLRFDAILAFRTRKQRNQLILTSKPRRILCANVG